MSFALEKKIFQAFSLFHVFLAITAFLVLYLYSDSLVWMYKSWTTKEEYSHGIMIPFVSLYLIWQRKQYCFSQFNDRNWIGFILLILGLFSFIIADLATVYVAVILSFMLTFYGLVLLVIGWQNFKSLSGPLFILMFMVPLPNFIYNNLSSQLQLLSSQIGVSFIRLFDISVYLEGNVIDLGTYKLQVVEACSGLRYLFPLIALGFILSYLSDIKRWMKVLLFISTVPITVIMNSIRIGAIGVSVEYWGPEMAEGLLHDIEGWFMFMASFSVLLLELLILLRITSDKRALADVFSLDGHHKQSGLIKKNYINKDAYFILGAAFLSILVCLTISLSQIKEQEYIPKRLQLNHFPLIMGKWQGIPDTLDSIYIDALKFDDYLIADYRRDEDYINFYIAYYGSQSKGESAHSPRSCIPGGGWRIQSIETVKFDDIHLNSQVLQTNRAVIQKGDHRQIVYYWFQQRGRIITNEYLVKWYLFWDSLNKNRTDGALVRLTIPLGKTESIQKADNLFSEFMQEVQFRLNDFIPNPRF
tara:strand:+ start:15516 stop:17105 length:1590 start_codon:yes stop_codon:yes gene_type:complete